MGKLTVKNNNTIKYFCELNNDDYFIIPDNDKYNHCFLRKIDPSTAICVSIGSQCGNVTLINNITSISVTQITTPDISATIVIK